MAFSYLLGLVTAALAFAGRGLLRGQQVPALVLVGAGAALLLSAAGLSWALWVITAPRRPRSGRPSPAAKPKRPAAPPAPAGLELPTVTQYYENASDGVLPVPSPLHRDLDPASDPAFAERASASA